MLNAYVYYLVFICIVYLIWRVSKSLMVLGALYHAKYKENQTVDCVEKH